MIANINGAYYALGNMYTHMGGDLSKGTLERNGVTCPKHRAKFDVTTLKVVSGPKMSLMHLKIQEKPTYILKIERNDTDRR